MKILKPIMGIIMILVSLGFVLLSGGDILATLMQNGTGFSMNEKIAWTEPQQQLMESIGVDDNWYVYGEGHREHAGAIYRYVYGDGRGLPPVMISLIALEIVLLASTAVSWIFGYHGREILRRHSLISDILFSVGALLLSGTLAYPAAQWIYVLLAAAVVWLAKTIVLPEILGSIVMIIFLLGLLILFFILFVYKEAYVTCFLMFGFFRNLVNPDFPMWADIAYTVLMYVSFCWFFSWINCRDEGAETSMPVIFFRLLGLAFTVLGICLLFRNSSLGLIVGTALIITGVGALFAKADNIRKMAEKAGK